jgi:protoporphyrinogen oxidase
MALKDKTAIIIGAGPAGLTAAYELIARTDIKPIIFEKTSAIGGISQTIDHHGNRMDIGGHRFFSKSDRVMSWWLNIMPMQGAPGTDHIRMASAGPVFPANPASNRPWPDPDQTDRVMLVRKRLSRIFYLRKFFDYPISLNLDTVKNLKPAGLIKIALSYAKARFLPIRNETSLEDFLINRFGKVLYGTFFRDYTEKVWGMPCNQISSAWGRQRIKGLSISKAILHALRSATSRNPSISQKEIETSLIDQFLYPKYGPGQMWQEVLNIVESNGGEVFLNHEAIGFTLSDSAVDKVIFKNHDTGHILEMSASFVFSTMPVKDLIAGMRGDIPQNVKTIASGLKYRDFITVGLLLHRLKIKNNSQNAGSNVLIPDNWIYIQEKDVKLGRLQIFNNWSPYLVRDPNQAWIGLEYFCNEGDELWSLEDDALTRFAISELEKIGIIDANCVIDSVVIRMPKTYPAYWGSYHRFNEITAFTDRLENLFLIGRNGMHKYNNQDHSMLTAMVAVDNILSGNVSKDNLWSVNTEDEYHEFK